MIRVRNFNFTFFTTVHISDTVELDLEVECILEQYNPQTDDSPESGGGIIIEKITRKDTGLEITDNDFWERHMNELVQDAKYSLIKLDESKDS